MGMPELDGKGLPERAELVGQKLKRLPLSGTTELVSDTGLSTRRVERGIRDLREAGFSGSAEIGVVLPAVTRHWLTQAGLKHFGASDEESSWHLMQGLGNLLLFDPAKVEAVHAIARRYATRGWALAGVQFFERQPMIASVEYIHPDKSKRAHLVIVWASILDNERMLCDRLAALPQAMDAHSGGGGAFRPDGLALVGDGEWGAARALYMASATLAGWASSEQITAWFYGNDGWRVSDTDSLLWGSEMMQLPTLSGLMETPPEPTMSVRQLGRRSLEGVLAPYLHTGRAWPALLRLLTLVGQYPMGAIAHYQNLVGESPTVTATRKGMNRPTGTTTKDRMKRLKDLGLVTVAAKNRRAAAPKKWRRGVPVTLTERGQGGNRYITTTRGRVFICYAHGGKPSDLAARTKLGRLRAKRKEDGQVVDLWPYQHEDILFELLGQLTRRRCPFAPGWQARATLANGQRIDPDAVILVESLRDRSWHYLEVELSDVSYRAILPRCAKYASAQRRDSFPVLVVCPTDTAECNWHRAGREFDRPPRLLTTTLARLKEGGVFGEQVWSSYGEDATIYGLQDNDDF